MSTVITLPYDPDWKAHFWAKKNCPSYITNSASSTDKYDVFVIHYYFSQGPDVTAFALKWTQNT